MTPKQTWSVTVNETLVCTLKDEGGRHRDAERSHRSSAKNAASRKAAIQQHLGTGPGVPREKFMNGVCPTVRHRSEHALWPVSGIMTATSTALYNQVCSNAGHASSNYLPLQKCPQKVKCWAPPHPLLHEGSPLPFLPPSSGCLDSVQPGQPCVLLCLLLSGGAAGHSAECGPAR